MIPFQTMSITDFVNTTFPCDCGKEHRMDMDRIMVSEGAIQDIPDLMAAIWIRESVPDSR